MSWTYCFLDRSINGSRRCMAVSRLGLKPPSARETLMVEPVSCPGTFGGFYHTSQFLTVSWAFGIFRCGCQLLGLVLGRPQVAVQGCGSPQRGQGRSICCLHIRKYHILSFRFYFLFDLSQTSTFLLLSLLYSPLQTSKMGTLGLWIKGKQ